MHREFKNLDEKKSTNKKFKTLVNVWEQQKET